MNWYMDFNEDNFDQNWLHRCLIFGNMDMGGGGGKEFQRT